MGKIFKLQTTINIDYNLQVANLIKINKDTMTCIQIDFKQEIDKLPEIARRIFETLCPKNPVKK